jgi:hypothetical protein
MNNKLFKRISIVSYLLIILNGQMIGLPFFIWLIYTSLSFGNNDQLFAVLAILALIILFKTSDRKHSSSTTAIDVLCFLFLLSPLVARMTAVELRLFNYPGFIFPASIFFVLYLLSLFFHRQVKGIQKENKQTKA